MTFHSAFTVVAALLLLLGRGSTAIAAAAPGGTLWLHVAVDEPGSGGESVRVNLPLSLAEAILPLIDEGDLHRGRIRIEGHDLDAAELRALREAVRTAPEGEYVRVLSRGEEVEIARSGNRLVVRADDDGDKVRVQIPMAVVDSLLAGAPPGGPLELDLLAAIRVLGTRGAGELVSVVDGESSVRIWLDDKAGGP